MKGGIRLAILLVVLVAPFSVLNAAGQIFFFQNSLVGDPVPDFTSDTLQTQKVSMSQLRGSNPAVVFFWATWCPHCRTQLEELNKQKPELEGKGVKVMLVDLGEDASDVSRYLKRQNITMDSFLDSDGAIAEKYSIMGVPTFVLVDKDGIVRFVEHALPKNYGELILKPLGK